MSLAAFVLAAIVFVPLDDRPVTRQLPQMLGAIAGRNVIEPPRNLLGNYLVFGKPDAIIKWLNASAPPDPSAFVISNDMLAYGGLVASRVPGASYADARFRLNEFNRLHRRYPQTWIGSFGTIMRLAPTGVPALGSAASFFAAYPLWQYLQDYANLHDPPLPSEQMRAAHLRDLSGATLQAYLETRARNWAVDMYALDLAQAGSISNMVLGQDDAGPVGLHVKEVATLQARVQQGGLSERVSVEPGADELGMALVARALARGIHWTPRISVRYSTPEGAAYNDPLEYSPIDTAIGGLVALCGGERVDAASDIDLYVRVPHTGAQLDSQLLSAIEADEAAHKPVALADLTFLEDTYADQAQFAARLLASGAATGLDAYASWNTNANTVGTALAEAVAAGVGRRAGTYNALAHKEFTFNRFVDDYLFHDVVRPQLNTLLDQQGVTDHTYLLPPQAALAQAFNRAALWNRAAALLPQLYPGYHIAAMNITLPWNRTFETEIDASLAPGVFR